MNYLTMGLVAVLFLAILYWIFQMLGDLVSGYTRLFTIGVVRLLLTIGLMGDVVMNPRMMGIGPQVLMLVLFILLWISIRPEYLMPNASDL